MIINFIFLITFLLLWKYYEYYSKNIGLYLSIFTFFIVTMMPSIYNYKTPFMIKMHLIIFTSICIFAGILYECIRNSVNKILTWLIRLNIGILCFAIDNYVIKGLLLFSTITTPYVCVENESIALKSSFIDKDVWVILSTVVLFWFYNENIYFKTNSSFFLILMSLIIPFVFHFVYNKYFESRAILLCLSIIFDNFNHNKNLSEIIKLFKY